MMIPSKDQINTGLTKKVFRGRPVTASMMCDAKKYPINGSESIINGFSPKAAIKCPRVS